MGDDVVFGNASDEPARRSDAELVPDVFHDRRTVDAPVPVANRIQDALPERAFGDCPNLVDLKSNGDFGQGVLAVRHGFNVQNFFE